MQGWALWRQQLRALLAKRALCALRDAWAALVQVGSACPAACCAQAVAAANQGHLNVAAHGTYMPLPSLTKEHLLHSLPAPLQVAVPVLLVLLALWGGRASAAFPQQPPLLLDRRGCVGVAGEDRIWG